MHGFWSDFFSDCICTLYVVLAVFRCYICSVGFFALQLYLYVYKSSCLCLCKPLGSQDIQDLHATGQATRYGFRIIDKRPASRHEMGLELSCFVYLADLRSADMYLVHRPNPRCSQTHALATSPTSAFTISSPFFSCPLLHPTPR